MASELSGIVIEVRPKALYRVRLNDGNVIIAMISTKMRHAISRLLVGDQVVLTISQNDPHRGQIIRTAN